MVLVIPAAIPGVIMTAEFTLTKLYHATPKGYACLELADRGDLPRYLLRGSVNEKPVNVPSVVIKSTSVDCGLQRKHTRAIITCQNPELPLICHCALAYLTQAMNHELIQGLNRYFGQFSSTRQLVDQLIKGKSHPQEILILLCSRIDALASTAAAEDDPRAEAFARFVSTYSGNRKLFESVSAGDLFYELDYHLWLMPGMLEKAGRLHVFSGLNEPIIKLLVASEIPLTLEEAQLLIRRIQRGLRKRFRVAPKQRRDKPEIGSHETIRSAIISEFSTRSAKPTGEVLRKALDPLISSKTLARILYEKFRCGVIHGGRVRIDEPRFFIEKSAYWVPMYSEYYGPFQFVEFPARFLASLFSDSIQHYRKRLEATGKVPPGVHFEMFPDDPLGHIELIDENLLPKGRTAVPR